MKKLFLNATAIFALNAMMMAQTTTYCNASLLLDGIDDFGAITNVFFQNTNQRDFTIEFYLKPDASQSQYPGVWGKTGFWSEINVTLYTPGKVSMFYATSINGNQYFNTDTVSWTANTWDHFAIVGDGLNNELRIYKNGILDAVKPHGTPIWSLPNNDSKIGAVYQGWTSPNIQYLKGRIDDFRVSDIARYTTNFSPPQNLSTDSHTRVLYNFNSITGNVVPDLSGNNNNLTLQNGANLDPNDVPYGATGNSITAQPSNQSLTVGNNAFFTTASSDPNATYQWQTDLGLGFQNLSNAGQYSGATNDTLTVNSVNAGNNNQAFRCVVSSSSCTDTTTTAYITITTGITENTSSTFTIFPNPANTTITVSWSTADVKTLTLTDAAGRAVRTYNVTGTQAQLSLEGLASGVYFLSGDGEEKVVQKIIKQ